METLHNPTPRTTVRDESSTTVAHQPHPCQRKWKHTKNTIFLGTDRPRTQSRRHRRRWPGGNIPRGRPDHPSFRKKRDHKPHTVAADRTAAEEQNFLTVDDARRAINRKENRNPPLAIAAATEDTQGKTSRTPHPYIPGEVDEAPPPTAGETPQPAAAEGETTRAVAGHDSKETKDLIQRRR
ncbi:hypothetical protein PVAP13_5KG191007 [Panicum virgatum]|uniref:Uncharacterized protein n=1 Tax=Panicum virgatum TaxID=38727 RepID=A0A8T0SD21_PANVG|nr:hypothetical protein PVAP13_5KG191007 [Panicum virgatum]